MGGLKKDVKAADAALDAKIAELQEELDGAKTVQIVFAVIAVIALIGNIALCAYTFMKKK